MITPDEIMAAVSIEDCQNVNHDEAKTIEMKERSIQFVNKKKPSIAIKCFKRKWYVIRYS